ncbi:MAG: hypothetical protein ACI9SC_003010 [Gammaproteobacteria bacterium]
MPVKVQYENGKYVKANLHDLSPDGLQIRCDQDTANKIHPAQTQILKNAQPSIVVGFSLPKTDVNIEIIVKCSICYFGLLPPGTSNEVAFGLQFKQFSGDCRQHIKKFFLSEMESA